MLKMWPIFPNKSGGGGAKKIVPIYLEKNVLIISNFFFWLILKL